MAEISMITPKIKEEAVLSLVGRSVNKFAVATDATERLAHLLMQDCAIGAMDALHVAVAIENGAEIFITTDDIILNKNKCISQYKIKIKNPCEV